MAPRGLVRRAGPWRVASDQLKQRSPGTWDRIAGLSGRVEPLLEPLGLARDYPLSLAVGVANRAQFRDVSGFVMFVGYPRSGHSIVGSLLNAHPNVVIGHRLRVLRYIEAHYRRDQINGMVLTADRRFARMGRIGSKRYDYSVPNQWQGRFTDLKVIGDSNVTNNYLRTRPGLLGQLRGVMGVPVRVVHVVRNPFDNIATMSLRNEVPLEEAADRYFSLCEGANQVRAGCSEEHWFDLRHEELLEEPEKCLRRLCEFMQIDAADGYLQDCAGILYRQPHLSRSEVTWAPELLASVEERMAAYPHLRGYSFTEPGASFPAETATE